MKKILIPIFLLCFFLIEASAQTRRMDNVAAERTYTAQNQTETVQPLLLEATRLFRMTDFEEALNTLDNAVAQNPNSAEALASRARFKKIIGMETQAEADKRKADQINPYAASIYGYYGSVGLLKVLAVESTLAIEKLTDYDNLNYYYRLVDRKLAKPRKNAIQWDKFENIVLDFENGDLAAARTQIDEYLIEYPTSSKGYDFKGVILKKEGKIKEAKTAFDKAIELNPKAAISFYNLGQLERQRKNYAAAEEYLNKADEFHLRKSGRLDNTLTKIYFDKALLMKQLGKTEEAIEAYNRIIELEGDTHMEALVNRGLTKEMMGDFAGAKADLDRAVEEFPEDGNLHRNRGSINLLLGRSRNAIDDYSQAIKLNGDDAEAYYNRAIAFLIIFDKISACSDFQKSMELGYEPAIELEKNFCTW